MLEPCALPSCTCRLEFVSSCLGIASKAQHLGAQHFGAEKAQLRHGVMMGSVRNR